MIRPLAVVFVLAVVSLQVSLISFSLPIFLLLSSYAPIAGTNCYSLKTKLSLCSFLAQFPTADAVNMAGHFTYNYQRTSLRNLINDIDNPVLRVKADTFQQLVDQFITGLKEETFASQTLSMIIQKTVQGVGYFDRKGKTPELIDTVTSWLACQTKAISSFESDIGEVSDLWPRSKKTY